MRIPFSKGNEVEQKPIPHNIFITAGPATLNDLTNIISRSEEQGWTARFLVFAGAVPSGKIAMQNQSMIPLYSAVLCKFYNEGDELVNPVNPGTDPEVRK